MPCDGLSVRAGAHGGTPTEGTLSQLYCLWSGSGSCRNVTLVLTNPSEACCCVQLTHPKLYCRPVLVLAAVHRRRGCAGGGSAVYASGSLVAKNSQR